MTSAFICGTGRGWLPEGIPDLGDGFCCLGRIDYGPTGCTCWTPVYTLEQQPIVPGTPEQRPEMCGDCAYRPGSPERSGDPNADADSADLDRIAAGERSAFFCHDGMRRIVEYRHTSGAVFTFPDDLAYDPPIREAIAYRADGTPALLCAGWAARRRALTAARDTAGG